MRLSTRAALDRVAAAIDGRARTPSLLHRRLPFVVLAWCRICFAA